MRYLPHTEADRREMLDTIGAASVDALFAEVPADARLKGPVEGLSNHLGEYEVESIFQAFAMRNTRPARVTPCFIGGGAYWHHVPSTVDHLIQRGEFLTSYTPYQPEVSQGTLQYLFEFQTQVALLTGMEVANASMYDGSTATAEAVLMANRITRRSRAIIAGNLHPHYRDVVETQGRLTGLALEFLTPSPEAEAALVAAIDDSVSCVVVQNPDFFGNVRDLSALAERCHEHGALLVVVVTEVVSLGLMTPPGEMGADIVVCEGQSIGVPLSFGGPYVGLFACREKYVRQMPGRLAGETVDADGRRGWVLTLSTREQHIRREKATSNICTNSGLCALAFTIHLSLLGEEGLSRLARINHGRAVQLAERLSRIPGVELVTPAFFNEFTLSLPTAAEPVVEWLAQNHILAGLPVTRLLPQHGQLENMLVIAATERVTLDHIERFANALETALPSNQAA
jgi:glycine dehydrogenase subunit 1